MQTFSERLKQIRIESGYTQKDVANGIKSTEAGYQNYESGRRLPKFDALIALADFFDVSLDYLVGRSDKKN